MAEMNVVLSWDDDLGSAWLNEDNLASLLYGQQSVLKENLSFREVTSGKAARRALNVIASLIFDSDTTEDEIKSALRDPELQPNTIPMEKM